MSSGRCFFVTIISSGTEQVPDLSHSRQVYVLAVTHQFLSHTFLKPALFGFRILTVLSHVNGDCSETLWKNREKDLILNLTFCLSCFISLKCVFFWAPVTKIPFKPQHLFFFRIYHLPPSLILKSLNFWIHILFFTFLLSNWPILF